MSIFEKGSKEYVYYDVNSEQEEIIEVPIIHIEDDFDRANGIQGFRKRDGKSAFIPSFRMGSYKPAIIKSKIGIYWTPYAG